MPRPNMLLESLGELYPPYLHRRYDPTVADNYDPDVDCPHKPWQTYTKYPCSCGRELWPPRGRGRGESLYSPRRIQAKMRAIEAMTLRGQGCRWRVIADKLGYCSAQSAWNAVQHYIDQATAIRNWERTRRENGGRPHYPRPTLADLARFEAAIKADAQMAAERIETAERHMARILAGKQ